MQPEGVQKVFLYIVVTATIEVFLTAIIVACIVMAILYCFSKKKNSGNYYLKPTPINGAAKKNGDVETTGKTGV